MTKVPSSQNKNEKRRKVNPDLNQEGKQRKVGNLRDLLWMTPM